MTLFDGGQPVESHRVPSASDSPSEGIKGGELAVCEHLSHATLHEHAEGFNRATLEFLIRQKL